VRSTGAEPLCESGRNIPACRPDVDRPHPVLDASCNSDSRIHLLEISREGQLLKRSVSSSTLEAESCRGESGRNVARLVVPWQGP
jgi:hypothetical protein